MNNLRLNNRQQKLFDENIRLARLVAARFIRAYPDRASQRDELFQAARVGLAWAAKRFDPSRGVPFPPYARKLITWQCSQLLFGRREGSAAERAARRHERSTDEVLRVTDDGNYTRGDLIADLRARQELQSDFSADNLAATLADVRSALTLATLTPDERRFLRFRYVMGIPMKTLARRMGRSVPWVTRVHRTAVAKLREHFAARGAVAPHAPLPPDGNEAGCPRKDTSKPAA